MRNIPLLIGAVLVCCLVSAHVDAQQEYTVVYELYYQLTLYPENADELIRRNQTAFDSRFHSCLNVVQERAAQASRRHIAYCNQITDPHARSRCIQNDEGRKFWTWCRTLRSVARGEVRWSDTLQAQAAFVAKQALGAEMYEQIVRSTVPKWRSMLVCQ